jgi:predicted DNA-binding transcriptional regulator YafY
VSALVHFGLNRLSHTTAYPNHPTKLMYTNYKGETRERHIIPLELKYDISEWHGDGQATWLLICWDLEKEAEREFELSKCNFDY